MTIQISSSEVLKHLNNYGITSVDDEALKLFIQDLKKLIKYELRKNSENLRSESNKPHMPQKLDTFIPVECLSCPSSKRNHQRVEKEISNVYPYVICRCEPVYHCGRIHNCGCHLEDTDQSDDQAAITSLHKISKNPEILLPNKPSKDDTSDTKNNKLLSNVNEPVEKNCQTASLTSRTRSHSGGRTKKLSRDPVELYQYYQSIWKKHTLPGENNHAQLRRSIRDRLMKVK